MLTAPFMPYVIGLGVIIIILLFVVISKLSELNIEIIRFRDQLRGSTEADKKPEQNDSVQD